MNLITIALVAVIVLVILAVVLAFVLYFWLDIKLFDFFMDLGTGKGPLEVRASNDSAGDDTHIALTITNHGSNKMRLHAVEGSDASGKRVFPVPMLSHGGPADPASRMKQFARITLAPGESATILLDRQELAGLTCQSLGIRAGDSIWPADDVASLNLTAAG